MKGIQINEFGKFKWVDGHESLDGLDDVKVRLTKALITEDDVALMCGEDKTLPLPFIPVRFAVGKISELDKDQSALSRGDRVVISAVEPCGSCPSCVSGADENCYNFVVAGKNKDGFLKDFAVTNVSNVYPLPQSVKDQDAIYLEYVSLALSVIEKLNVKKSSHVAIVGGNVFASILAQLLIYYQAVPIMIDDKESSLRHAKKLGIYYTVSSLSKPEKEIATITGGRMANSVVYVTRSGISTDLPYKIAAPHAPIVFAGFSYPNLKIPTTLAMNKQLDTFCISSSYGNHHAAINLLATKAIDLSHYEYENVKMSEIEQTLEKSISAFNKKSPVTNVLVDLMN